MTRLIAHRGAHAEHTENSLDAFAAALEQGAAGVELDVRHCASGEVVVCHDPDLRRVAGRATVVEETSWQSLREIELSCGGTIPLLDHALDLVIGGGAMVNIEIKGDVRGRRRLAAAVAHLLTRRSAAERDAAFISSFDPVVLIALRARRCSVPLGLLFDAAHTGPMRAAMLTRTLSVDAYHPHHALCTASAVARWRRRGRAVHAWTVNDLTEAARLRGLGVDSIITDDIPALRSVV